MRNLSCAVEVEQDLAQAGCEQPAEDRRSRGFDVADLQPLLSAIALNALRSTVLPTPRARSASRSCPACLYRATNGHRNFEISSSRPTSAGGGVPAPGRNGFSSSSTLTDLTELTELTATAEARSSCWGGRRSRQPLEVLGSGEEQVPHTPPRPADRASAAAHRRRERSLNNPRITR